MSVTCNRSGFSPDTAVSSTNKIGHHDITEILLKMALSTINLIISKQITINVCFNIPHFQLLLHMFISFHESLKTVPGCGHDWMVVHFIDWWSFSSDVTCRCFDQSKWNEHISNYCEIISSNYSFYITKYIFDYSCFLMFVCNMHLRHCGITFIKITGFFYIFFGLFYLFNEFLLWAIPIKDLYESVISRFDCIKFLHVNRRTHFKFIWVFFLSKQKNEQII